LLDAARHWVRSNSFRQQRAFRDEEIATALAMAGFSTGTGRPFDVAAVRWLRPVYRIQVPSPLAPGEVTVAEVAATLGITEGVVDYWIKHGQLEARQDDRRTMVCALFSGSEGDLSSMTTRLHPNQTPNLRPYCRRCSLKPRFRR